MLSSVVGGIDFSVDNFFLTIVENFQSPKIEWKHYNNHQSVDNVSNVVGKNVEHETREKRGKKLHMLEMVEALRSVSCASQHEN